MEINGLLNWEAERQGHPTTRKQKWLIWKKIKNNDNKFRAQQEVDMPLVYVKFTFFFVHKNNILTM